MKNTIMSKYLLLLLLLSVFVSAGCSPNPSSSTQGTDAGGTPVGNQPGPTSSEPIAMDFGSLIDKYNQDTEGFLKENEGKTFAITGQIEDLLEPSGEGMHYALTFGDFLKKDPQGDLKKRYAALFNFPPLTSMRWSSQR